MKEEINKEREKRVRNKLRIGRKGKSTVTNEQKSRRMLYIAYKMSFGLKVCFLMIRRPPRSTLF
jgi:hypothetical protein